MAAYLRFLAGRLLISADARRAPLCELAAETEVLWLLLAEHPCAPLRVPVDAWRRIYRRYAPAKLSERISI